MLILGMYIGVALTVLAIIGITILGDGFGILGFLFSLLVSVLWLPILVIGGTTLIITVLMDIRKDNIDIEKEYVVKFNDGGE